MTLLAMTIVNTKSTDDIRKTRQIRLHQTLELLHIKEHNPSWVQWLTPVITALRSSRQADHLRSGVRDQPGQHGETLSLLKIQKISWTWWCAPIVSAT